MGADLHLDPPETRWQNRCVRAEFAIAILVSIGAAACAGGGDTTYHRAATEACLKEIGHRPGVWPSNELPLHGGPAADGVLRVDSGETEVGIAFDADADKARQRVEALETTASQWSPNPWFDVFERKENVVYWARGGSTRLRSHRTTNCSRT